MEKLLYIIFEFWEKNRLSRFWVLSLEHFWYLLDSKSPLIIGQRSQRIVRGGREGGRERGKVDHLWHLFSSKSPLIIGQTRKNTLWRGGGGGLWAIVAPFGFKISQKSRKIAWYYRRVLKEKVNFRGREGAGGGVLSIFGVRGSWSFLASFGIKIMIYHWPKNSRKKNARIIGAC